MLVIGMYCSECVLGLWENPVCLILFLFFYFIFLLLLYFFYHYFLSVNVIQCFFFFGGHIFPEAILT